MSSHSLSFLGYEDIGDFLSLHNDFANLFVNQEGYIYKFDNFSWIDFVLYSGSANKKAIIRLKNNQETEVDISIKEIHLAHPLNDIKKIYSVKILSDSFHKISGMPKSNETGNFTLDDIGGKEPTATENISIDTKKDDFQSLNLTDNTNQQINTGIGGFSLSSLIEDNQSSQPDQVVEKDDFLTTEKEEKELDTNEEKSFILNIDNEEVNSQNPQNSDIDTKDRKNEEEDIKLDFLKADTQKDESDFILKDPEIVKEEENPLKDFLLKNDDEKVEEKNEETLSGKNPFGFHLLKEEEVSDETKETTTNSQVEEEIKEDKQESFLNLLKTENETQTDDNNLNFLQPQEESKEQERELTVDEDKKESESGFKLDFLKSEPEDEQTKESTQELIIEESVATVTDETNKTTKVEVDEKEHEEFNNRKKSDEIIQQIKDDIKEIDAEYKKTNSIASEDDNQKELFSTQDATLKNEIFSLDIQESKEEEPKESINDFQIKESENIETNRSFTSTLKGLFENSSTTTTTELKDGDSTFEFNLKASHDSEESKEEKSPIIEQEVQTDMVETSTQEASQEFNLSSLSSLGLDPEDEFDLLSDFISDAKDSIETIEQFIQTGDFDKINYALVKIKSSAEILSLDAIIENSNSMRKHCITQESEKITKDTEYLKKNINLLEKHLEATAI
jgi:HPt (histidine-containing phosphotransfer) domain-containing protein